MTIKKYSFDNGKYEIHAADDGSSLVAYRHGEFWQNMIGDNLTAAMLHTIDDLHAEVYELMKHVELGNEQHNTKISYSTIQGY